MCSWRCGVRSRLPAHAANAPVPSRRHASAAADRCGAARRRCAPWQLDRQAQLQRPKRMRQRRHPAAVRLPAPHRAARREGSVVGGCRRLTVVVFGAIGFSRRRARLNRSSTELPRMWSGASGLLPRTASRRLTVVSANREQLQSPVIDSFHAVDISASDGRRRSPGTQRHLGRLDGEPSELHDGASTGPTRGSIHRHRPWRGFDDMEFATMTYVDWFDHDRLHGEITDDAAYTTPRRSRSSRTSASRTPVCATGWCRPTSTTVAVRRHDHPTPTSSVTGGQTPASVWWFSIAMPRALTTRLAVREESIELAETRRRRRRVRRTRPHSPGFSWRVR